MTAVENRDDAALEVGVDEILDEFAQRQSGDGREVGRAKEEVLDQLPRVRLEMPHERGTFGLGPDGQSRPSRPVRGTAGTV